MIGHTSGLPERLVPAAEGGIVPVTYPLVFSNIESARESRGATSFSIRSSGRERYRVSRSRPRRWTPHVSPVIPSIMVAGARREVTGILAEEGVPVGARSRVGARDARARRLTEGR